VVIIGRLLFLTAIGGRPKFEICFLLRRLRWKHLPKERCGDLLSCRGSYIQTFN